MNERKRFGRFVLIVGVAAAMVCLYLAQAALAETVEVGVRIRPKHIRLSDDDAKPYIICHVVIPEEFDPEEFDPEEYTMDVAGTDVEASKVKICDVEAVGLFEMDTVCSILEAAGATGNVDIGVTVVSGETTLFGSGTIKVSE